MPTRRAFSVMLGGFAMSAAGCETGSTLQQRSWGVFYGREFGLSELGDRELLVLDPAFAPDLAPLQAVGVRTLGYISLGEVDTRNYPRSLFANEAIFLRENTAWTGTVAVDVRDPAWRTFVLETLAPPLIRRGFQGFFLDTLDTPPYMEAVDPAKFSGLRDAAIRLVADLRAAYPDVAILMNRGYALLPEIRPFIDGVVAESLLTQFDFDAKVYRWVDEQTRAEHLKALQAAEGLPIFSLDYWDPADTATIAEIYRMERALGHRPYVSVVQLDRLLPEPGGR